MCVCCVRSLFVQDDNILHTFGSAILAHFPSARFSATLDKMHFVGQLLLLRAQKSAETVI